MTDTADSATKVDAETSNGICRSVRAADAAAGFVVGDQGLELVCGEPVSLPGSPFTVAEQRRRAALETALRILPFDAFSRTPSGKWEDQVRRVAAFVEAFISEAPSGAAPPPGDR